MNGMREKIARSEAVIEATSCGGCGAKSERERCIGCLHDFGTPDSAWVRRLSTASKEQSDGR